MRQIIIFSTLLLFIFAVACCPCRKGASSTDRELATSSWKLLQLNGKAVESEGEQYTLTFDAEGRVGGVAACNRITGSYTYSTDKRTLTFDHMGMTRMLCHGENVEDEYGRMFSVVTHYEVDGQTLILLSRGESVALFRRM